MKIKVTKQETIEADVLDYDAKIFIKKYLIENVLKLKYMINDYYSVYDYIIENNKVCLVTETIYSHYSEKSSQEIRVATEEDIAIFKVIEILQSKKEKNAS